MDETINHGAGGLADLIVLYRQLSKISSLLFAPLAQMYVGHLTAHAEPPLDSYDVVNLALRKLAFEAGEIMLARNPPTDKPIGAFERDKNGELPDFSLAQVAAAALAYVKYRDDKAAKKQQQAAASAVAPQVEVLGNATTVRQLRSAYRVQAYQRAPVFAATAPPSVTVRPVGGCGCGGATSTSSGGCGCGGGCGGTTTPPPKPVPCYDPCAGGLIAVPPYGDTCGCSCQTCQPPAPADCTDMCSISCETKLRLRDCIKQLVCDMIAYIEKVLCTSVKPGTPAAIICNFLHCVREAICPPPAPPCLPPGSPLPCLPCDYAVENS